MSDGEQWRSLFGDAHEFILRILEESEDSDTLKRAQSIHDKSGSEPRRKSKKKNKKGRNSQQQQEQAYEQQHNGTLET